MSLTPRLARIVRTDSVPSRVLFVLAWGLRVRIPGGLTVDFRAFRRIVAGAIIFVVVASGGIAQGATKLKRQAKTSRRPGATSTLQAYNFSLDEWSASGS